MKILLFAFCFLATSSALAQISGGGSVLSAEPVVTTFNSHSSHASQMGMGDVQNVMETSNTVMAQGERPLWELAPKKVTEKPLGDTARALKQEHMTAKKANAVWEN